MSPIERSFIVHLRVLNPEMTALIGIANQIEEACIEEGLDIVSVQPYAAKQVIADAKASDPFPKSTPLF